MAFCWLPGMGFYGMLLSGAGLILSGQTWCGSVRNVVFHWNLWNIRHLRKPVVPPTFSLECLYITLASFRRFSMASFVGVVKSSWWWPRIPWLKLLLLQKGKCGESQQRYRFGYGHGCSSVEIRLRTFKQDSGQDICFWEVNAGIWELLQTLKLFFEKSLAQCVTQMFCKHF